MCFPVYSVMMISSKGLQYSFSSFNKFSKGASFDYKYINI